MNYKTCKFKAFTLAEVLITLGIIGVVAALTIPTLTGAYKKRITVIKLKQTYSIMVNALKLAEEEYGSGFNLADKLPASGGFSPRYSEKVFNEYFAPYLKVNFKYSDQECKKLSKMYPQKNPKDPYSDSNHACYNLMNGTSIMFGTGKPNANEAYYITFMVIINPNQKYKIIGKDAFGFALKNGDNGWYISTIVRVRYPKLKREDILKSCGAAAGRVTREGYSANPASYCSELLIRDNWKFHSDYPIKF